MPPADPPDLCDDTGETGIVVLNTATVTSGGYTADDDACQVVHFDDVGIEKTARPSGGRDSVEPGDPFDYVLTVTNNGTGPATNVHVIDDDLSERLDDHRAQLVGPGVVVRPVPAGRRLGPRRATSSISRSTRARRG